MNTTPSDHPNRFRIDSRDSAEFARTLDHAVDTGFSALPDDPQADGISRLLSLLDTPAPGERSTPAGSTLLVDITLARIMRRDAAVAGRVSTRRPGPRMLARDEARVDALVESGFSAPIEPSDQAAALVSLLDAQAPASEDRSRLINSTLSRVQEQIDRARTRLKLSPVGDLPEIRRGFRLSDLAAVAAAVVIFGSVLWPMAIASRSEQQLAICASNLSRAAIGFSLYAADNDNQLPLARASFLGGTWWNVGEKDRSHSANLYRLISHEYAALAELSCPTNHNAPVSSAPHAEGDWRTCDEISFSYQLPGPRRQGWGANPRMIVLADRSPVVPRARRGELFNPHQLSPNHSARGQNALLGDGSLIFMTSSILPSGDNVWLPGQDWAPDRQRITGREVPRTDSDVFLGP